MLKFTTGPASLAKINSASNPNQNSNTSDNNYHDDYGVKEDHGFSNQQLKNINSQLLDESGNKRTLEQYSSKIKRDLSKTASDDHLLSN